MLNYTAAIFAEAGSQLSPNMSAIVVGVIQLIGSYFTVMMVDRSGRKASISAILQSRRLLNILPLGMCIIFFDCISSIGDNDICVQTIVWHRTFLCLGDECLPELLTVVFTSF